MIKYKFYGTRGSYPIDGEDYLEYGGATSCIVLNNDKTTIMLDCGSGASSAVDDLKNVNVLHLFISHLHLDHISSFPALAGAFSNRKIHVYGKNVELIKNSLNTLMGKPLWPVNFCENCVIFHELNDVEEIENIKVTHMKSNHPDECMLYRFDDGDNCVVSAFDFNHADGYDLKLIDFARDADVLIYDGMFSKEEYESKSDWGHSTAEDGARIAIEANVKKLIITHFGKYSDDELSYREESLRKEYPFLSFARIGKHKDKFKKVLEIGTTLTSGKDSNLILETIIRGAMDITGADGGTLYLLKDDELHFEIMITKSKNFYRGLNGEEIDLPPVKLTIKNVCAASVIQRKTINIPDVYNNEEYDFSGPRNYDKLNNYKTTSALVVPMTNDYDEIIGVIQLINASDENGDVISFDIEDENIIEALSSQAAITLTNVNYANQINELLFGFVKVISAGIDERTPYNANHTRNMVKYAEKFLDYQKSVHGKYEVKENERREIIISIWLHDIGKLITPLSVMNKNTRLGEKLKDLENRYEKIGLLMKLDKANGKISFDEYSKLSNELNEYLTDIRRFDNQSFMSDEDKNKVNEIFNKKYIDEDGNVYPYLTDEELKCMNIVKGTLTDEERKVMEDHVVMTSKMLSGLEFPRGFKNVPFYAGAHHEYLNGKGYPNHLDAKDLPWQVRLITIIDVFEALTAKDRPYKAPMPAEKAFLILDDMVKDGQIDKDVLASFKESEAWI